MWEVSGQSFVGNYPFVHRSGGDVQELFARQRLALFCVFLFVCLLLACLF